MKVFFSTADNGDGSSSVNFFETQKCITALEEADPETYGSGEGGDWFEVPDGTVIEGITIHSEAHTLAAIESADGRFIDL